MEYRIERDSLGEVKVPVDKLWGAQTQRSLDNFKIGKILMPTEIIRAFAILKRACAIANAKLGILEEEVANEIAFACDEIEKGNLDSEFPLVIFQTGSGTQSNMNFNEVIANYVNMRGKCRKIHPNDDVNRGQSSNDTFPAAMHIAAVIAVNKKLIPAIDTLFTTLVELENRYMDIVKIGRTHLQDATPITLGQEISAWAQMLCVTKKMVISSNCHLYEIALGATAVGTGLNCHPQFDTTVANEIATYTCEKFITAENKFHSLTSKDAVVHSHGAIKALACNLMKIASDVRLLASGPRCGIGEIAIPENEPGSSIMPGKVNPTQCEALTMVCAQVFGNDTTITYGAAGGQYQLNVFMPVIIHNYLQSVELISEAMISFNDNCAIGIVPNHEKIDENLNKSLMLVTALNPYIGYENSAKIAKYAHTNGMTLKEAALELEILTSEQYDDYVKPEKMVSNKK